MRCRGAVAQLAQSRDGVLGRRMLMKSQAIGMTNGGQVLRRIRRQGGTGRGCGISSFASIVLRSAVSVAFFLAVSARSAQRAAETIALSTGGKT